MMTERVLSDDGSHEVKQDGMDLLKQMGVLFKAASLKETALPGTPTRPWSMTIRPIASNETEEGRRI